MVVVARDEENQEHRDVLGDGDPGPDVRDDVVAVVRAEHDAAVGEEEVARRSIHQVDHIEHMQVYVGRNSAVDKPVEKRKEGKPAKEDHGAHAAVNHPIELQVGAQQLAVVVGDGLVHRAYDGRAETEFGQHEDAEDRPEKTIEPQIRGTEEPKEQRAVQKREQKPYAARCGIGDHVSLHVFLEIKFHPKLRSPDYGIAQ